MRACSGLVASKVAIRAAKMASVGDLRPIGVVENMSHFITPQGERIETFTTQRRNQPAR